MEKATHKGILHIGELEIPCYVTEDGHRIISGRRTQVALGVADDDTSYQISGKRMVRFLEQKSLKPLFNNTPDRSILEPVKIKDGRKVIVGYDARLLPHICDVMLKARRDGNLSGPRQKIIAKQCEILLSGFAQIGILALVDEATGYQEVRDKLALQKILEKYIAKELQEWVKTFPDEFYREMFRLKNWHHDPSTVKRPSVIGKYTNDLVYERISPKLLDELRKKNPVTPKGHRKHRHHQWLTGDIGHPQLREHIAGVIALMRASANWNEFMRLMNRSYKKPISGLPLFRDIDDE